MESCEAKQKNEEALYSLTVKRMILKTTGGEEHTDIFEETHQKTDEADFVDESEVKYEGHFLLIVSTF